MRFFNLKLPLFPRWVASLQQATVIIVRVRGDQGFGITAEIAPTQQVQTHFAPERAFISQSAGAALARAEPYIHLPFGARSSADGEGGATNATFAFRGRHDDFYGLHGSGIKLDSPSESTVPLIHAGNARSRREWAGNSNNLLGVLGAAAIPARYDRHDRSVARRPSATAGTIRQHLFQLSELAVGRVDGEGERMVAASSRDGSIRMQWAIVKTFHNSLFRERSVALCANL